MFLLYDRDCGFCRWSAAQIARRAPSVAAQAIQSTDGQRLLEPLAPGARLASVHAAGERGIASGGAAIVDILGELPHAKTLQRVARAMPGVTNTAYNTLAAHRQLLGRLLPASARARADEYLRSATALRSGPGSRSRH